MIFFFAMRYEVRGVKRNIRWFSLRIGGDPHSNIAYISFSWQKHTPHIRIKPKHFFFFFLHSSYSDAKFTFGWKMSHSNISSHYNFSSSSFFFPQHSIYTFLLPFRRPIFSSLFNLILFLPPFYCWKISNKSVKCTVSNLLEIYFHCRFLVRKIIVILCFFDNRCIYEYDDFISFRKTV